MDNKIKRIQELVNELKVHDYNYYVLDNPTIADKEYDNMYYELEKLEKETGYILSSSPTQRVQGEVLPFLKEVEHTVPMLSAEKSKDINKVVKFMKNKECVLSFKLDGLTLVLRYDNGELQQAITRGGGDIGEDVTHTVRVFTNVPLKIDYKGYLEIRGEGLVSFKDFERINEELINKGLKTYSNVRNLAAGSTRQLDANITKERNLFFIAFGIIKCDEKFKQKHEQLDWLRKQGFEVVYHHIINKAAMNETIELFQSMLPNLSYLTDGLIIEYNDIEYGKAQGKTGHHSKSLYALKFDDSSVETVFRNIKQNTTRTGMCSITAYFDTVNINGTNVSNASLHNYDIYESLELGVGDIITVYKANSVIPQVKDNLTRSNTYKLNMFCPSCNSELAIKITDEARFLFCENDSCPSQLLNKFVHFVSKNAMDIEGLSKATLEKFINAGFLETLDDIYALYEHKDEIIKMDGFGERSYQKLINNIEKSRKVKCANFIYALGIPQVGKGGSKIIAEYFDNDFVKFINTISNNFDFSQLKDFGDITNKAIHDWYADEDIYYFWYHVLDEVDIIREEKKEVINSDSIFNGKKVYCTGSFSGHKKQELKDMLEGLGAEFASGYAKSLDMLIVGSLKGSSKVDKAIKDGIPVMTEEEFLDAIK